MAKSIAIFLSGVIFGGVGAAGLVIYWRRMRALEELAVAQRLAQQAQQPLNLPPPSAMPQPPAKPAEIKAKMHEIARERAGLRPMTLN